MLASCTQACTMPQGNDIATHLWLALIAPIEADTMFARIVNAHELIINMVAIVCQDGDVMPAPSVKKHSIIAHGVKTEMSDGKGLRLVFY